MQFILTILMLLTLAGPIFASDGVLEINQACATSSTGCFPGDTQGFPIQITASGSFRLTGNLNIPAAASAIVITATNVTLDLGGFTIKGPNVCTGYPISSCTSTNGSAGIDSNQFFTVVRNGNIIGMAGSGIHLSGASSAVSDVRVLGCGGFGIDCGAFCSVIGSVGAVNYFCGVEASDGSTVEGNDVHGNRYCGIGITPLFSGVGLKIVGNRAAQNGGIGIYGATGTLMSKNISAGNSSTPILMSGSISTGDNVCNTVSC